MAIFPAHDERVASSRIRAFTLARALAALGCDTQLGDARGADVVLIQKRATRRTLDLVRHARANGALVLYDVDDLGAPLWYTIAPSVLRRMLQLADVVTTDTAGHRQMLLRDYAVSAVELLPDAIDYAPSAPVRPPLPDRLRLFWFGHAHNATIFERYARALGSIDGAEIVAATGANDIARLAARFPNVSFVPWSLESFVSTLQSCALAILPHDGGENDRAKSNNRMIASITWGVPAIVSRTPEYERTAMEAGVASALFSDERELIAAVERFRSADARRAYLDAAQPEIWRRYAPRVIAERFLEIVEHARRGETARTGYVRWLRRAARGHVAAALLHEARHFAAEWSRGA